ncbi:MAG: Fic family protein, partial [Candidatus Yonathbacteria bacterium]|nr:Fic family protein [Candidatus Yonathbacteria bacterium]
HGPIGIAEIKRRIIGNTPHTTLSRYLKELRDTGLITASGSARAVKYSVTQGAIRAYDFDLDVYESSDVATAQTIFNHDLFTSCETVFTNEELKKIVDTTEQYHVWKEKTPPEYQKLAYERCAIEFAWKSSQIEGNTYSLLETEALIKNKVEAKGKPHDDATMILNQKNVFDLIVGGTFTDLFSVQTITDMHKMLVADLGIPYDLRIAHVGITGTNYTPLQFQSQIREALERLLALVQKIDDPFQSALILLAGIAYIQPFADGNKRTSRHMANALLYKNNMPPVAWRMVDEVEYKKCVIAFYELGNIRPLALLWLENYIETTRAFFTA